MRSRKDPASLTDSDNDETPPLLQSGIDTPTPEVPSNNNRPIRKITAGIILAITVIIGLGISHLFFNTRPRPFNLSDFQVYPSTASQIRRSLNPTYSRYDIPTLVCNDERPFVLEIHGPVYVDHGGRFFNNFTVWQLPGMCDPHADDNNKSVAYRFVNQNLETPNRIPTIARSNAILLAQRHSNAYFHMLIESLPRLTLFPESVLDNNNISIVLAHPIYENMLQFLDWLQLSDRYDLYHPHQWINVTDRLYVPSLEECASQNPAMLRKFRRVLWQRSWMKDKWPNLFEPHFHRQRRQLTQVNNVLYLERPPGKRYVNNDLELLDILRSRFPKVRSHKGTDSLKEQLQLFYESDLIIGPHGAGFSNLIFSRIGTTVIEFMPRTYTNPCFEDIAGSLGLEYHKMMVINESSDGMHSMTVNPSDLNNMIDLVIEGWGTDRLTKINHIWSLYEDLCRDF